MSVQHPGLHLVEQFRRLAGHHGQQNHDAGGLHLAGSAGTVHAVDWPLEAGQHLEVSPLLALGVAGARRCQLCWPPLGCLREEAFGSREPLQCLPGHLTLRVSATMSPCFQCPAATVSGSGWFLAFWTVSRPLPSFHSSTSPQVRAVTCECLSPPSARTSMMAGSRAARRQAVSADSSRPRGCAWTAGGPRGPGPERGSQGHWPAWEPGPGCASL